MAADTNKDALAELGKQLGDAKFRRAFNQDPKNALADAGIDFDDLPEDFVWALAELTTTELRLVGDLAARLQQAEPQPGALGFPI